MTRITLCLPLAICISASAVAATDELAAGPATSAVVSLDGDQWLLAPDPANEGREHEWYRGPRPEAKPTKVPWIIQDAFPGYHGVAWYWREFDAAANPHEGGRWLLRFWAVDYLAEVWLNGTRVGGHEGGESPFVLDVTEALQPGARNLLAVRVLNPTNEPIDGIVLAETPHRNKALPYRSGSAWDQGGIIDSVELLAVPALRIDDLFVRPDWETGKLQIEARVFNAAGPGGTAAPGRIEFTVGPAASGETLDCRVVARDFSPGETTVDAELQVPNPHLWNLNDPFLYRVSARVAAEGSRSVDERSVRCGFRDFRFADGYFRLNGRRIYLRSSHTGNCCPIGLEIPHDPDLLRRDLLNVKAMGFNAIRFIAGVAKRYQLDLCDEIGLMVYEEAYASWCLGDSPKMAERYDESILGMVRRDRNHPSVVIWGLLNETPDGPVFRRAVGLLPAVRELDDSRMVMLNSGRFDGQGASGMVGLELWRPSERDNPCVVLNGTGHTIRGLGITWAPGQLSFHPGQDGEYAVVRWTAPADETIDFSAAFVTIAERATTDVHVLDNGKTLFDGFINVKDGGPEARFQQTIAVRKGGVIDCVCGYGNGNYGADTTALAVVIKSPSGTVYDSAADYSPARNPNGPWSYGQLAPGPAPKSETFKAFSHGFVLQRVGSLSNPGSLVWEDVISDQHPYQRVPHTAEIIDRLRTLEGSGLPLFISEYGVGSAIDLVRVVRHYEQLGKPDVEDAQFYRTQRDLFLEDWNRWHMADTFDRPEDYFQACLAKMAGQRLLGLNAIRANPSCVGYSLTGTVDQGMTGEGLTTTFREPKPGTFEALFDGLAPLRWCLFAEPVNVYRGTPVRLEAVLANEDALLPGEYPVRVEVLGPGQARVFEREVTVTIPEPSEEKGTGEEKGKPETSFAMPVFSEEVVIDGPPGEYRLVAAFERGAAAAGRAAVFYVDDPAEMPPVEAEVVLWGEDSELQEWLAQHGVRTRPFAAEPPSAREVILASRVPQVPGGAEAFAELARRVARGSTVVFLSPEVFRQGDDPVRWLPLRQKGSLAVMRSWVYLKDEWARRHPIFDGLPAGGLMDLTFYRELIPDVVWAGQEPPAQVVAGAINTSQAYSSGLLVTVNDLGAGRFVLNTLAIRDQLGRHPAAERLLRNMLRFASEEAAKPLAELPPDFADQLKAMGFAE